MRYSGRHFNNEEINWIKKQLTCYPDLNRTQLSQRFCEHYNWKKPNGTLKDVSCRVAFVRMEEDGLLNLPSRRRSLRAPKYKIPRTLFGEPQADVFKKAGLISLSLELVENRRTARLWNEFIDRYHYLGYTTLPGAQLRYFIMDKSDILGCLGFSAAAWTTAPRDEYIGWTPAQRERNLHLVVNNSRFLLLPWIHSFNLGSRVLSLASKQIDEDWQQRYHFRPIMLETFVDRNRFPGTVYKASNWIHVGETTGRGKKSRTKQQIVPIKSVWVYPLVKNIHQWLCR